MPRMRPTHVRNGGGAQGGYAEHGRDLYGGGAMVLHTRDPQARYPSNFAYNNNARGDWTNGIEDGYHPDDYMDDGHAQDGYSLDSYSQDGHSFDAMHDNYASEVYTQSAHSEGVGGGEDGDVRGEGNGSLAGSMADTASIGFGDMLDLLSSNGGYPAASTGPPPLAASAATQTVSFPVDPLNGLLAPFQQIVPFAQPYALPPRCRAASD